MKNCKIKNSAVKHFAEKGFFETSVQEIAQGAGLNKATFYYYYKNKTELYLSLLQDHTDLFTAIVKKAIDNCGEETGLELILKNIFYALLREAWPESLLLLNNALLMVLHDKQDEVHTGVREILICFKNELYGTITNTVARYVSQYSDVLINLIISYFLFIKGFLEWTVINNTIYQNDSNKTAEKLWENFWNGCKHQFSVIEI